MSGDGSTWNDMEMPSGADPTCEAYGEALAEIVDRIKMADDLLTLGSSRRVVEFAALNLRHALEGAGPVVLGHSREAPRRDQPGVAEGQCQRSAKARRSRRPRLVADTPGLCDRRPEGISHTLTGHHGSDFMTADEWGQAFGLVSGPLHARNPFASLSQESELQAGVLSTLVRRLLRLLRYHTVSVPGDERLLFGQASYEGVRVVWLERTADGLGPDLP